MFMKIIKTSLSENNKKFGNISKSKEITILGIAGQLHGRLFTENHSAGLA